MRCAGEDVCYGGRGCRGSEPSAAALTLTNLVLYTLSNVVAFCSQTRFPPSRTWNNKNKLYKILQR